MRLPTIAIAIAGLLLLSGRAEAEFKAGAAVVDVTPTKFPVLVNGGMYSRSATAVKTKIQARAIVLDDSKERVAIVVVDSCMMSREVLDEAKQLAAERTQIKPEKMMISATHTHTAPSSMGCLGTSADPDYVPVLKEGLAKAIAAAEANLEPAKAGWAVVDAGEYTALRRWIRRPDRIAEDPFGNPTVRANMHAGRNWDDVTGESGPEDPDLSMISFQSLDGRPIALYCNFSMHYFGDQALSADYYGLYCDGLATRIAPKVTDGAAPFVAVMSHGCSGDIWRRDYTIPAAQQPKEPTIQEYADRLSELAYSVYGGIQYKADITLAMAEERLPMKYRVPNKQLLEWAQRIVEAMGDRLPENTTEVYAREQVLLHEKQSTEVVVQALRIGDMAIATTPTETYALTGLKIKLQSPLQKTMVLDLANGGDGYIPPPEQHLLGGYNTWAARSAGLEVQAEPRIAETAVQLLEAVTGKPRRAYRQSQGAAAKAILQAKPLAYWRLDEFQSPVAKDSTDAHRDAYYDPGVVFFLEGPKSAAFCTEKEKNRAAHFAGGRVRTNVPELRDNYSISLWFWNGMPNDAREITGWMISRDREHHISQVGDHLGIGGKDHPGVLVFQHGSDKLIAGSTAIERWTWNHAVFVREGDRVRVYLNGAEKPEIDTYAPADFPEPFGQLFFGGRADNQSNWEGRLDEIAIFDRALTPQEITSLSVR